MAIISSLVDKVQHVLLRGNYFFVQAFDINSSIYVLSNIQIGRLRVKQVKDLLVVNLKETALDQELKG